MTTPSKLKVYELAKELDVDPQYLVDLVKRLGIDIKNSMSVIGSEEVRTVRDHYKKNKPVSNRDKKAKATPSATSANSVVSEKRVGATVIRRRASQSQSAPPAVEEATPVSSSAASEAEGEFAESQTDLEQPETGEEMVETTAETVAAEETEASAESAEGTVSGEAAEASASPQATGPAAAPAAPVKPRKIFPSIIKKVSSEQYLGETVGPKIERPKRDPLKDGLKKDAPKTAGATPSIGPKRIREINPSAIPPTEAEKSAAGGVGKKRTTDRQPTVFKSADFLKREMVHSTKKKKAVVNRPALRTLITTPAEHKRVIEMAERISVADFAKQLGVKAAQVIAKLMGMGVSATINETIDHDTATLLAGEFNYEVKQNVFREADFLPTVQLDPEKLKARGPVVTIMGHVDHGKTSLLDYIRKSSVAAGEAGGITQHIGAYQVAHPKGAITFLDTPGHEAFTAMRARGAKVTDIVIIVVSSVDGVMPQTLESINHAQAAKVPILVAINKCDLPDANPDRIKQTLAGHNLAPEEWGGETIYVSVSAKTGKGVDQLLDAILLQAEMLELKANFESLARGTVIECKLDKARGAVATVLVQHGVLKIGDLVVAGAGYGKVRALTDSLGKRVDQAGPSTPVEILGLPVVPNVGDELVSVSDEKAAKELTDQRADSARTKNLETRSPRLTLEEMLTAPQGDKELRIILKADVQGSAEALRESLTKFPQDRVRLKLLHFGTGGVTESDIMLAHASRALVLGFNVRPEVKALKLAEVEGVTVRTYSIIYDLLEDVKRLLEGLLDSTVKEKVIGRAEVRQVFSVPKVGVIAGSAVIDGKVQRGCFLRLLRDSRVVYEGKITSLRRLKDDVKEVNTGFECGIGLENFTDIKQGDQLEAFLKEEIKGIL